MNAEKRNISNLTRFHHFKEQLKMWDSVAGGYVLQRCSKQSTLDSPTPTITRG